MEDSTVISGCIKVEKTAAAIYKKFTHLFPGHKDVWKGLFDDEIKHMAFLKDVKSLGLIKELQKRGPLPTAAIIDSTQKLADTILKKTGGASFSIDKALNMVLKLEESMVETYTNKTIADLMPYEDEMCLKDVVADEKTHIRKIKGMMKSISRGSR